MLVAFAGAFAAAGPGVPAALATPLNPSDTPLPPPGGGFQGADGNQDDDAAAGWVDWQAKLGGGRVRHNPDPNAQDSAFVGGSKEGLPDQWAFTTEKHGVSPPKANILDAWQSIEQRGPDKFVYLAFARGGPGTRRDARRQRVFDVRAKPRRAAVDQRGRRADPVPADRRHADQLPGGG